MSPEQEREIEAREECARRGIDPDEICADGGVTAWMVVDQEDRPLTTREKKIIDQAWETHKAALPTDDGDALDAIFWKEKYQQVARRLVEAEQMLGELRETMAGKFKQMDAQIAALRSVAASDAGCGRAVMEPWRD